MKKSLIFWIIAAIIISAAIASRGLLVEDSKAVDELATQGYSEITIVNHVWFCIPLRGGATDDCARFEAMAKNPAGKMVTIYVYSGWPFKGATIRSN